MEKNLHVVGNGITVVHATSRSRSRQEVREELSIPWDTVMLLGFGWTPELRGGDTLEALGAVLRKGTNAVLVLVGVNDDLKEFVDSRASDQLRPSLRGIPAVETGGDLFAAAQVLISASRAEGFSYSVAEAMADASPVASTNIPALAWAANAPGFFFFPVGDNDAPAELIGCLLKYSPEERLATWPPQRNFRGGHLSIERWAESVVNTYLQFLTSRGGMGGTSVRAASAGWVHVSSNVNVNRQPYCRPRTKEIRLEQGGVDEWKMRHCE